MRKYLYLVMTDQVEGFKASVIKALLWCLALVFRLLISFRSMLYKTGVIKCHKLPVPVISVGNITVGGSGKTPLVSLIVQELKKRNVNPVILTRGYMADRRAGPDQSDEALMLAGALEVPVLAGSDRAGKAKGFLKKNKADIFVLDDGFQHWRLSRDLDIVVIDVTNPWGNGYLLPRGILRESRKALLRAHIFVLTKVDLGKDFVEGVRKSLEKINPEAPVVESIHKPVVFSDLRSDEDRELSYIRGKDICTVCGIASPNAFIKTLIELEANIGEHYAFMDHHCYQESDVKHILEVCRKKGIVTIVTTEKDAAKIRPFLNMAPKDIDVLSLKIEISIVNGGGEFFERIDHLL